MPPSVHKLTPFEKRLRRIQNLRGLGHSPTAANCFFTKREDLSLDGGVCDPCKKLASMMDGKRRDE